MAKANPGDPASIDGEALARGAEAEEYNVGPEEAVGVALRNLKEDPHCYDASLRDLWMSRRAADYEDLKNLPIIQGAVYTVQRPLVVVRWFRTDFREADLSPGYRVTIGRLKRNGRISISVLGGQKVPLRGLRIAFSDFEADPDALVEAVRRDTPQAPPPEHDYGQHEPPSGDTADRIANRIWDAISSDPAIKKQFMDAYHSVDVSKHTGVLPALDKVTGDQIALLNVIMPDNVSARTWDGIGTTIVRKIERETERAEIDKKVAEAEAKGKVDHAEYGDVFPQESDEDVGGVLGDLMKNSIPKLYVCRGCGEQKTFTTNHWGDVYEYCSNSGQHPNYERGQMAWVCAGLPPEPDPAGKSMSQMRVKDVPTVDPDAEFDKLIKQRDSGEITPEQFNEKSRRLFGFRQTWMMRRAAFNVGEMAAKVFVSYKRDRSIGLDEASALDHSMRNWEYGVGMSRSMGGQPELTGAEVAAVRQMVQQMILDEGGGQAPGGLEPSTASAAPLIRTAKDAQRDYSCVMVNVTDPDFVREFKKIVASIPDEDIYDPPGSEKYGREDRPHVTVKYGLHTEHADDVSPMIVGFGPIEIRIMGVSFFRKEGKDYDVLKFDVESDDLRRLRDDIESVLETTDEHKDYVPHMTIAYLKRGTAEKYVDDKVFADMAKNDVGDQAIPIESVCFSDHGSKKVEIPCVKTASAKWWTHLAKKKRNPAYEKETEVIRQNKKKPEARKPHDFKPAKWTHPNGHPRCLVCGDEERTGGRCNVNPSAKERVESGSLPKIEAMFERGEVTHTDLMARAAMTDETERLLGSYYEGGITQTDLDLALRRLRNSR